MVARGRPVPGKGKTKVQVIQPTGELRKRAVNYKKGFSVELTSSEMIQLEKVVHQSKDRFVSAVVEKLQSLRAAAQAVTDDGLSIPAFLKSVERDSFEMKGLGGTFDFPLLTQVAKSLNDYVRGLRNIGKVQVDIIILHVDALYVILARHITGEGGATEAEVLSALLQATRKFG
jgi:hypothetical protein